MFFCHKLLMPMPRIMFSVAIIRNADVVAVYSGTLKGGQPDVVHRVSVVLHEFVDLHHQRLIGACWDKHFHRGEEGPSQVNVQAIIDVGLEGMLSRLVAVCDFVAVFDAAIVNLFCRGDDQFRLCAVVVNQRAIGKAGPPRNFLCREAVVSSVDQHLDRCAEQAFSRGAAARFLSSTGRFAAGRAAQGSVFALTQEDRCAVAARDAANIPQGLLPYLRALGGPRVKYSAGMGPDVKIHTVYSVCIIYASRMPEGGIL